MNAYQLQKAQVDLMWLSEIVVVRVRCVLIGASMSEPHTSESLHTTPNLRLEQCSSSNWENQMKCPD